MAPSTTWLFVTIVPPGSQITPLPSASPRAVRTRMVTIDGETRWTTCGMRSKVSPVGACEAVATAAGAGAVTVFVTVRVAPQPATKRDATRTESAESALRVTSLTSPFAEDRNRMRPEPFGSVSSFLRSESSKARRSTMGDRTQRLKGKANELAGKTKGTGGYEARSANTEAKGAAQTAKGKAQQAVGKARSKAKKATR